MDEQFNAAFGTAPMFGRDPGPLVTGPLNLGGNSPTMLLAQLVATPILQQLMGQYGMRPLQFMPMQNVYDFDAANRYYAAQQQAAQHGARADVASLAQLFTGGMTLMSGQAPTLAQQQRAYQMATTAAPYIPLLTPFLGTEITDQLFGARGSAGVMAQQFHRAGYTAVDPVTGRHQWSGETAGTMANEVYARLYGPGQPLAAMRGIGAGAAGEMFGELHARGLGIHSIGSVDERERYRRLATTRYTDAEISRMAEDTERIQKIRATGRDPTQAEFAEARRDIIRSHEMLRDGLGRDEFDPAAISRMPGVDTMLRASDAQRISDRLKNLSGAVTAMRDIFGDLGRPNAPMREIINGLEALTQGGLAHMSPNQLDQIVRLTHNLAKQTGIGVQAMIGLTAQGGAMADQLGLDRSFAVHATQGAAAFGHAFGETARLDIPTWGGLSKEEATLQDQRLRLQAAASGAANQMGATVRLYKEGIIKPGTEAAAMAEALMQGRSTYEWQGRQKSVMMGEGQWTSMLNDAGVNNYTARAARRGKYANQEYTAQYGLQDIARDLQADVDIMPRVADTLGGATAAAMHGGLGDILKQRGVARDDQDVLGLSKAWGKEMARAMQRMPTAVRRDNEKRQAYIAKKVEEQITTMVRRRGKAAGKSDARIEADVQAALASLGQPDENGIRDGARQLASAMWSDLDAMVKNDPRLAGYKDVQGLYQMHSDDAKAAQRAAVAEARTTGQMQAAMAGLGRVGPLGRLTDAIRNAKPGDDLGTILSKTAGIDVNDLKSPVGQAFQEAAKRFQDAERYTGSDEEIAKKLASEAGQQWDSLSPAEKAQYAQQAKVMRGKLTLQGQADRTQASRTTHGVVEGGSAATAWLQDTARSLGIRNLSGNELPGRIQQAITGQIEAVMRDPKLSAEEKARRVRELEAMQRDTGVMVHAQQRGGLASELEAKGYVVGARVGKEHTNAMIGRGSRLEQLQSQLDAMTAAERESADGKKLAAEAQDAGRLFTTGAREHAERLLSDTRAMQQLGAGGLRLVRGLETDERSLRALAAEAGVSVADLLAGRVPAGKEAIVTQARGLQKKIKGTLETIADRQATGKMPTGDEKMGERELAQLKEEAAFRSRYATQSSDPKERQEARKAQAAELAQRLVEEAGIDADDAVTSGLTDELAGKILDGDRAVGVHRALAAREQLVDMASIEDNGEKYLLIDGKRVRTSQATAAQRAKAIAGLDREALSSQDQVDYDRLMEEQAALAGLGERDEIEEAERLRTQVNRFQAAPAVSDSQLESQKKLILTGKVILEDPNHLLMQGEAAINSPDGASITNPERGPI